MASQPLTVVEEPKSEKSPPDIRLRFSYKVSSQNAVDDNVLFQSDLDGWLSLIGIDGHLKLLIISLGEEEA